MRSPSPRRRYSPRRRLSSPGYKRNRSRSRSRGRRQQSPSPRYGKRSSPSRRSHSRRRRSRSPKRRSRSPKQRSRSPRQRSPKRLSRRSPRRSRSPMNRDKFGSNRLAMDHVQPAALRQPISPILKNRPSNMAISGMRSYGGSPDKSVHSRLSEPQSRSRGAAIRPNTDPYHDHSGDHGDRDYRNQPPGQSRFDQTNISFNERFGMITGLGPPFSPAENITIGIERNIPGNEPSVIDKEITASEVVIVRQKEEGSRILSDRVEFLGAKDEVEERRTIRVADEPEPRGRSPVAMYQKQGMTREELDNFLLDAPTPSSGRHGDRDERIISSRGSRPGTSGGYSVDHDERFVLEKRFTVNLNAPPGFDEDFREGKKSSNRFDRDPRDLRHNLTKKRDPPKDDSRIDARQKILKKKENDLKKREEELKRRSAMLERREKDIKGDNHPKRDPRDKKWENLPDFSNRPDKFQMSLPPDTIPTGGYYYEHDNRDQPFRGRGRGGRGSMRGRGVINRSGPGTFFSGPKHLSAFGKDWKHDKFDEMEDNKPSSTTKN